MFGSKNTEKKWREDNAPTRALISTILQESLRNDADRISLGTPNGCVSKIEQSVPAENSRANDDLLELEKNMGILGIASDPIFSRSPNLSVPIWFRIKGSWTEVDSVPFRILHEIIYVLESMFLYDFEIEKNTQRKVLTLTNCSEKMYVELWFENNFTYTIATGNFENNPLDRTSCLSPDS